MRKSTLKRFHDCGSSACCKRVTSGKSRQQLVRLLEAGYAELIHEARRLEQEFARLDAESLKWIDR